MAKKSKKKTMYFPKIYYTAHACTISIVIWLVYLIWNWSWERMQIRLIKLIIAFIFNLIIILIVREKTY